MEAPGSRGGLFAPSALLKVSQSISGGDTSSSLLEVDEVGADSEATGGLGSSHILSIEELVKASCRLRVAGGRGGDSRAAVINILVLVVAPGSWPLFRPSLPFSFCSHMFHIGREDYSKT